MDIGRRPVILVTGADRRQIHAAARLTRYGEVYIFGCEGDCPEGVREISSPDGLYGSAELLVLPITGGRNSILCSGGQVDTEKFTGSLAPQALAAGGMMSAAAGEMFHSKGFDTADYMTREELLIKNAVPTAEGTLSLIFSRCDETVSGMDILILGFGRVAKACARLLKGAGARVCVAARSTSQLAEAQSDGHSTIPLSGLCDAAEIFPVIINTVPAPVLTGRVLCRTRRDCLIIDLASKPGGTDFAAAEQLKRCAVHALALPGKHAPKTAGGIIADAVWNIYCERSGSNVT